MKELTRVKRVDNICERYIRMNKSINTSLFISI
nr:MAG TPA: hypothetical protein [Microviridae sp.]